MKVIANTVDVSTISQNGGPRPLGEKKPGKVSRSFMQHKDGNTFISQQQALKSQQRVKLAAMSAMEID